MTENNLDNQLSSQVLSKIHTKSVVPRSRWWFITREYGLLLLCLFAIIVGAFAMAVTMSVVSYRQASFYEVTHDSFLSFLIDVLPYLWIGLFVVMIILAAFNIKHLRRGYRHTLFKITIGSLFLSFVAGLLLHLLGLGFGFDKSLGVYVNNYTSQEKLEIQMWQNPQAGLLVGKLDTDSYNQSGHLSSGPSFKDYWRQEWSLVFTELSESDKALLNSGETVRIMGQIVESEPMSFLVCGVMPWVYAKEMPMQELLDITRAIKNRLAKHKMQPQSIDVVGCANMPIMKKIDPAE